MPTQGHQTHRDDAHRDQTEMQGSLTPRRNPGADQMRVRVAGQQKHLEEKQARGPYSRGPAEPGQDVLRDDRLDLEEEKCGDEDGGGVDAHLSDRLKVPCSATYATGGFDAVRFAPSFSQEDESKDRGRLSV